MSGARLIPTYFQVVTPGTHAANAMRNLEVNMPNEIFGWEYGFWKNFCAATMRKLSETSATNAPEEFVPRETCTKRDWDSDWRSSQRQAEWNFQSMRKSVL